MPYPIPRPNPLLPILIHSSASLQILSQAYALQTLGQQEGAEESNHQRVDLGRQAEDFDHYENAVSIVTQTQTDRKAGRHADKHPAKQTSRQSVQAGKQELTGSSPIMGLGSVLARYQSSYM